jgi:MFS family permease
MGVCFAIGIYVPLLPLTVGLSVLSGFLLGATLAPLGALVGDVIRANRRSYAYATQTTVAKLIGVSAAPLLGGLSVALGNLQLAMILFAIPLLLAGLLLFSRQKAVSQGAPVSTAQP